MSDWKLTDEEIANATWSSHWADVLKGEVRDIAIMKAQAKKLVQWLESDSQRRWGGPEPIDYIGIDYSKWQALKREVEA